MNVSKVLASTAAVASVVSVIGFSYAQTINPQTINHRSPDNTTQTQSDAALPCQPGPFNPHLPNSPRAGANNTGVSTSDCATNTRTSVQVENRAIETVSVQRDIAAPIQPAPVNPPVQVAQQDNSTSFQSSQPRDVQTMSTELEPRADRN